MLCKVIYIIEKKYQDPKSTFNSCYTTTVVQAIADGNYYELYDNYHNLGDKDNKFHAIAPINEPNSIPETGMYKDQEDVIHTVRHGNSEETIEVDLTTYGAGDVKRKPEPISRNLQTELARMVPFEVYENFGKKWLDERKRKEQQEQQKDSETEK